VAAGDRKYMAGNEEPRADDFARANGVPERTSMNSLAADIRGRW